MENKLIKLSNLKVTKNTQINLWQIEGIDKDKNQKMVK